MIAASACFSLMSVLVKMLATRLPTAEIVLARCALPLPFLILWLRRHQIPLLARNRVLMLARAIAGTIAMTFNYYALSRLPLADVSLLGKFQPVLIALLAPYLIGERPSPRVVASLVASMTGAVLVLQPSLRVGNPGGFAMMISAMASALAMLSVRRLSREDAPASIVLDFTAFTTIVAAIAVAPVFVVPTLLEAAAMIAMAALATAGQLLMTTAYKTAEAPLVSAASYTAVGFALFWGWIFWSELPGPMAAFGGALVVLAGLLLIRR